MATITDASDTPFWRATAMRITAATPIVCAFPPVINLFSDGFLTWPRAWPSRCRWLVMHQSSRRDTRESLA